MLLGYTSVKAAHKMLVILTQGDDANQIIVQGDTWAMETMVFVTDVPMFAPITIGMACLQWN